MEGLKKVGKERFFILNTVNNYIRPEDPVKFLG